MPCPSSIRRRRRIFKTLARVLAHPLLLLSLLLLLPIYGSPEQDAREANREALLQFKSSITADPGGLLSGWSDSAASDPCSWSGVSCDSRSRVWALNISGRGNSDLFSCSSRSGPFRGVSCSDQRVRLTGNLSPAIGKLSELRVLSLPFHGFDGKIPDEIWSLGNLSVLDLEGNSISGTLPSSFPPYLKVLNLGFNKLTDVIPPSLSSSVDLEIVNLSQNQLFGTIPGFFGKLDKLRRLDLSFNGLGGPVPDEIGSGCWSLEHMDLSGNQLVGGIPPSLGNCRELQSLLLFSNLFDDIIPPDLGNLTKLQVLDLSRNSLSGPVPEELGNCVELSVLVLSNPSDPVLSKDGETDDFNYFQGGIPENITSLPKLRMLWAPRVTLEGDVPVNWGACKSLEIVNLGQNLFTGQIPTVFEQCQNLNYVNLSSNKLTGWLSVGLQVPCMAVFDVSGNQLSGSVPSFIYKGCSSFNFLSDDLSTAYSTFFAGRRRRTGSSLPLLESSGNFTIIHNFGANNFSGTMPYLPIATERLGNQTVYAFLVDGNKLVGSFPGYLFDKCKDLNGLFLNISNNLISGGIPAEIGHMCGSLKVLDARGNRLSGAIPQSFGLLDSLVSLDLSWNRLHGEIPASIGQLKGLTYLSLAGNNLSGGISVGLGQLHSLEVLDLSSNNLSGEIPGDFVNLRNLSVLLLNNNKLSGKIPSGVANVMPLSMFNVSFNNLSGSVPSMRCDSILGNPLLQPCSGYSLTAPPSDLQGGGGGYQPVTASPPGSSSDNSSNSVFSSIEIASITSAAAIVSVLLVLIALYIYTRKCVPRSSVQVTGRREVTVFTDIGVPLTYENVVRATGSFNASNCIGSGGFGATYKAEIAPGVLVAIKRLSVGRFQGVQQFHAEIKTLGRWRHPNLVTLIGYHVSEAEMFLIYNYLPGGNLERFIQERSRRVVDWRMLHKIALDVARALSYLHDHCVPRILHRDVKPSNILLDNDFNAYLSDFGLARLLGNSETHATTGVAGTFGYVAPEYAMTCRVSDKADVYSYGVVLLELISDKKALDPSFSPYGNGFNIVAWACMLLRQGRAREFFTNGLWDVGPHDDLVETLHLAVMCTVDSLSVRPTMKQVVQRLKQLQPPTC